MFTNKASAQKKISSNTSNSNSKSTQLKVLPSIVKPFQIKSSEESLQGKFKAGNNQPAVQLVEDDEPLQGKFESANQPAQLMEEDEPLQGKFVSGERNSSPNWAFNLNSTNTNTNNSSSHLK